MSATARYVGRASCAFCKIIAARAPAKIVKEWADAIAIVPLNPVVDGHIIVLSKKHAPDALAYPMVTGRTMRRAAQLATGPCNIITSVGAEATQTIFHLHVHIVPRSADDGLQLPWNPSWSVPTVDDLTGIASDWAALDEGEPS